ncbi:sigma-54 interaction domain-containing protein [Megasphaera elsdenii]|uniref:sigma-54 interaction domain-containing protein n=1 Tax=Megasphaera elsdenii TaxID=907 RepID=UPI0024310B89|nr:sigma 54-interacting transcriptional regulator [Megasphaera elsdenii]
MTNVTKIFSTLSEASERLNAIIEHSFDGIFITDAKANVIRINHAYEVITGLKKEEVLGKNMADLVRNKLISESGSLQVIKTKQPVTLQQCFRSGKEALVTSSPIFDADGNFIMIVTNVRDLTEIYNLKAVVQEKTAAMDRLAMELEHLQTTSEDNQEIIAKDETTLAAMLLANRVASMDTTVILLGETGVGKEVMARYIFQHSHRAKNSFIKVNCGAIPENLIESELFGYEGGAFTGANKNGKIGLFELANKGTLFLDEIGELPKDMQVKLLRVLQEQEILRVGGTKPVKIDVRIIAATNRNLEEMVSDGTFREDLYYRLTVFPISIPPLRMRKKDIVPLALSFLEKLNQKYQLKKYFTDLSMQLLHEYDWPGNIRELKNIVERAIIISPSDSIKPEDLHIHSASKPIVIIKESDFSDNTKNSLPPFPEFPINLKNTLEKIEYTYMAQAYKFFGNVRDAAKNLGLTPSTFVRKRKQYQQKNTDPERM